MASTSSSTATTRRRRPSASTSARPTYAQALYALETVTSSFIVPVSPKLFMVVKDTQQKRTEVENTVAIAIPIPEPVTIQEAQELARGVQQLFELTKFAIDSGQRLAFIRGPVSKVEPARIVFRDLLLHRSQMFLEFEILSLSKLYDNTYGFPITNSYQLLAPIGVTNLFAWAGGFGAIQMTVATRASCWPTQRTPSARASCALKCAPSTARRLRCASAISTPSSP